MSDIYNYLIESNGENHQLSVAIEELSELTKELTKFMRNKGNKRNIAEEVADVEICLEQVKIICKLRRQDISIFKDFKLKRLSVYKEEFGKERINVKAD